MTTRPRPIPLDRSLLPGLLAVALFGIIAVTVLTASFPDPAGIPDVNVVAGLGYALIGKPAAAGTEAVYENTESFLVALVLIAILLDAAMDGALMLARRDEGGEQ